MAITVCPCTSGLSTVLVAVGNLTLTPCCNIGATSIMMMSSTSMTSTSGVTLISDLTPPLAPPRSIAMAISPQKFQSSESRFQRDFRLAEFQSEILNLNSEISRLLLRRLLDEVVDELRRRVVHLDVEVLDAATEVIVEPHRRNRDHQTERGLDERFRNTDRDGADAGRAARADALERVDDADDRAEQPDERSRRADRRQRRNALLQVGRREGRRALNRAADGVHQVFTRQAATALLLELVFLQAGEHHLREMAVAVILRRGQRDRVLEAPFLQVLRHLRRVHLRLVAGLRIGEDSLDRHAERPHRHDEENEGHGFGHESHRLP